MSIKCNLAASTGSSPWRLRGKSSRRDTAEASTSTNALPELSVCQSPSGRNRMAGAGPAARARTATADDVPEAGLAAGHHAPTNRVTRGRNQQVLSDGIRVEIK